MIICNICKKEIQNLQGLSKHISINHKDFSKQQYYDEFIKTDNEGYCLKCGKETYFQSLNRGYRKYCCKSHQVSAQGNASNPEVRNKMRKTMLKKYGVEEIFSKVEITS